MKKEFILTVLCFAFSLFGNFSVNGANRQAASISSDNASKISGLLNPARTFDLMNGGEFLRALSPANVITVNRGDDPDDGIGGCLGGYSCSLREAVNAAYATNSDDAIIFSSNIGSINLTFNAGSSGFNRKDILVTLKGALYIEGPGSNSLKIYGGGANNSNNRIFDVQAGDSNVFSISGVSLMAGRGGGIAGSPFDGFGGAIRATNTALALNDVLFSGNTAPNKGGAVALFWGRQPGSTQTLTVSITNSVIANNTANLGCGGIATFTTQALAGQPANTASGGTLNITNSRIYTNSAGPAVNHGTGGGLCANFETNNITNSEFYDNSAGQSGGAIEVGSAGGNVKGTLNVRNSTISGNRTTEFTYSGAGIKTSGGKLVLESSTVAYNNGFIGGGIYVNSGDSAVIHNSIIAKNHGDGGCDELCGPIQSGGYNFIGWVDSGATITGNNTGNILPTIFSGPIDPLLGALAFNGATTQNHSLACNSAAINAGDPNNANNPATDQRGVPRPQGNRADIGAFESIECFPTVSNSDDSGPGSLRYAIDKSNDGKMLALNPAFFNQSRTITLTGGELSINKNLSIDGGAYPLTISGNNQSRIFNVAGGVTLNLNKLILTDGDAGGASGGAINNYGTLNITNSAIVNNKAQDAGGGISNIGTLSLTNVTVSGNQSHGKGAGIHNNGYSGGSVTASLLNSTVTNNHNFGYTGAGVWNDNGNVSARNTIIDGNFSDQGYAEDYVGGLNNQGYNLIGTRNPRLAPLANNGGATLTHALLCGSAAIDAADPNNANNPATDQRGAARPVNGRADIGAVEVGVCASLVTNGGNVGAGSLRQAILDANTGGTISFASNVTSITLTGGELLINKSLTISNNNPTPLTISGNNQSRIFNIAVGATLNLNRLTITGGNNSGGGAVSNYGTLNMTNSTVGGNNDGGIGNYGGTMTILNSTISGNSGGGIVNSGMLSLLNSTVSGNRTNGKGAGIYNNGGGNIVATVLNSTITDNRGFGYTGAGVWNDNGSDTFLVRNSIIDGNFSDQGYAHDFVGGLTNQGNNLIGTGNSKLAPLGNYGGATQTHALLQTSPAIDAGNNCVLTANGCGGNNPALTTDERGTSVPRKIGASVDIGAFERNITFDRATLPNGNTGASYNQTLSVSRPANFTQSEFKEQISEKIDKIAAPFAFSIIPIAGQQLPPGLSLAADGTISGTPTMGGTFTFTVKATDADGTAGAQQYTLQIAAAPTAATVSVSGRVLTPDGRGLTNATVILTDASGSTRSVRTSTFGYYYFNDVEVGQTYIFTVIAKRYQFATQVLNLTEDLTELNFTAQVKVKFTREL